MKYFMLTSLSASPVQDHWGKGKYLWDQIFIVRIKVFLFFDRNTSADLSRLNFTVNLQFIQKIKLVSHLCLF